MNWNTVEDNWKQLKSKTKAKWGQLAGNQHCPVAGKSQQVSSTEETMSEETILPRRTVLRGILAVGCSLLVPISLLTSSSARADTASPAAAKKLAKASVHYQSHPKGEQKCGSCVNFIAASNTCMRVEGKVIRKGWCMLWTKKA